MTSIMKIERLARYAVGFFALLSLLIVLAFKLDWIRTDTSYKTEAWYTQNVQSGFVVVSEYRDEAECRRSAAITATCRSGKALNEEVRANATSIERTARAS